MRGVMKGQATRGQTLSFGDFGLKSLASAWLSSRQIEAARKTISAFTKKGGRFWIRVFPHKPISLKPPEVRMGGGKGPVDHYAAVIHAGTILFEMAGVTLEVAREAFRQAADKLPVPTSFVKSEKTL